MHKILRAKSQEPRAKSQEPRAKSQEPRAKSQEPRAKSQEPRAKSQEPRAKSLSSRLAHPAGRLSDSWRRSLMRLSGQPTPGSVPSPPRAQSLSRADRRSLRAFTVAALACAALMGFSATAQAQTEVWSATLTVKELSTSVFGCTNSTSSVRCSDFLSEDEFTYDSTDYAITAIFLTRNAQLQIHFDTDLTTAARP